MDNRHLFQLLNAGPGLDALHLAVGLFFARTVVYVVAASAAWAWLRAGRAQRHELLQMASVLVVALLLALGIELVWPQPRPLALHLGTQYFEQAIDASLPDNHTVGLWALGLAALRTRRYGPYAFPLLTLGLLVGLSHVYLGVHFPYDILAALPVAAVGDMIVRLGRARLVAAHAWLIAQYERGECRLLDALRLRRGR
jgi:undecaprenyl-diphosphatase